MRRAGIRHSKLHSLRHFYAAVLISAGYDIDAVSEALGHSSVAITSLIYSSLFEAAKTKMATKAEALVWEGRAAAWDHPEPSPLKISSNYLAHVVADDHQQHW